MHLLFNKSKLHDSICHSSFDLRSLSLWVVSLSWHSEILPHVSIFTLSQKIRHPENLKMQLLMQGLIVNSLRSFRDERRMCTKDVFVSLQISASLIWPFLVRSVCSGGVSHCRLPSDVTFSSSLLLPCCLSPSQLLPPLTWQSFDHWEEPTCCLPPPNVCSYIRSPAVTLCLSLTWFSCQVNICCFIITDPLETLCKSQWWDVLIIYIYLICDQTMP